MDLYDDLPKHLATAAFLLRTEVLGLKAWLAKRGVPGVDARCSCGHPRQTLEHVVAYCPDQVRPRLTLLERAGTTDLRRLLREKATIRAAAEWLLDTELLGYFRVAREIEREEIGDWAPFQLAQHVS